MNIPFIQLEQWGNRRTNEMGEIDKSLEISEILPLQGEYQSVVQAAFAM